jgi:hypothetical protein
MKRYTRLLPAAWNLLSSEGSLRPHMARPGSLKMSTWSTGRADANIARLVEALKPYQPYLRGAPPGLPFRFDTETVRSGLNFTLVTQLGWIDLLERSPVVGSTKTYSRIPSKSPRLA